MKFIDNLLTSQKFIDFSKKIPIYKEKYYKFKENSKYLLKKSLYFLINLHLTGLVINIPLFYIFGFGWTYITTLAYGLGFAFIEYNIHKVYTRLSTDSLKRAEARNYMPPQVNQ